MPLPHFMKKSSHNEIWMSDDQIIIMYKMMKMDDRKYKLKKIKSKINENSTNN